MTAREKVCVPLFSPFLQLAAVIGLLWSLAAAADAQEKRTKARISNAGFTITALPLLAAKDWGLFTANGLDMEIILMASSVVPGRNKKGTGWFLGSQAFCIALLRHVAFLPVRVLRPQIFPLMTCGILY